MGDAEEEWEDEGSDSWAADDFAAGQSLWGQDVWGGDEWTDPEWSAEEDPQPEEGEEGDEGDDWGGGDDWGSGADWGDHPWSDLAEGEGDAFEAEEDVLEEAVEAPVEAPVEVAGSGQVVPPERARFGSDRETYKLTDVEIQIPDLAELEGGSDEGRALVAEVESGQTREADAYRPTLREVLQDVLKDPNAFETMHVNQDALILQPYDKDAPPDPEAPPQLDCEVCFLTRAEGRPLTVGRHADSTVILDHGSISRVHAILGFMNDGWKIMDRSSNGCFMGEQRLPKERPIHFPYHARVRLGRAMVLHLSSPALLREFAAHVDL